jgi:CubicO group peptidase (beta-lactamase class C family)
MRKATNGLSAALLFVAVSITALPVSAKVRTLDPLVRQTLRDASVASLSVARIERGRIAWVRSWGEQSPGIPASNETLHNIASLTKPISAEAVLRLVSRGRLSLDEPMAAHWLDPYLASGSSARALTPRIALGHQTGFASWRSETGGPSSLRWEPGSSVGYSFAYVMPRSGEGMVILTNSAAGCKMVLPVLAARGRARALPGLYPGAGGSAAMSEAGLRIGPNPRG